MNQFLHDFGPKCLFGLILVGLPLGTVLSQDAEKKVEPVSFEKQIKPIFEQRCVHCHNKETLPDRVSFENRKSGLATDKYGKIYIVPGKPEVSLLVAALEAPDFHEKMMPMVGGRTTEEEVKLIRRWIAEGADWPKGPKGKVKVTFRAKE